jgi:regulator of replication initiation timing
MWNKVPTEATSFSQDELLEAFFEIHDIAKSLKIENKSLAKALSEEKAQKDMFALHNKELSIEIASLKSQIDNLKVNIDKLKENSVVLLNDLAKFTKGSQNLHKLLGTQTQNTIKFGLGYIPKNDHEASSSSQRKEKGSLVK